MKVSFNRGALSDIDKILTYIAALDPKAAADLVKRFERAAALVGEAPEIGIHYVRHGARLRPWEGGHA